jgi:CubicO group peptidase (beta-lactamase class C family)
LETGREPASTDFGGGKVKKRFRAVIFCLAALGALAGFPASALAANQDAVAVSGGTQLSVPADWELTQRQGLTVIIAPEGDARVLVFDAGEAVDGPGAEAAAWLSYGAERPPLNASAALPARDGWDEIVSFRYDVPPEARRIVQVMAFRAGRNWTVAVLDGSAATVGKRSAALALVAASLRPRGYSPESFAGREAHRLDAARIAELTEFLERGMALLDVPGVGFALLDRGELVHEGGLGVREFGKGERVDAHTRFMIASNTKAMTTALLAKAVDTGRMRWDQPVVELFPSFRLGDEETTRSTQIRHLVCACTGLPRRDLVWQFRTTPATPAADTFRQLAETFPTTGFGETFQYSNLMASAAGYIAGQAFFPGREIGAAYDAALQQLVWTPLGMGETTLDFDTALRENHASPHGHGLEDEIVVIDHRFNRPITAIRPAGGAWSSAHDMIRYVAFELAGGLSMSGERIVSEENLLARGQRGVTLGESGWYGMGLVEDHTWGVPLIRHGGDLLGFHSDMLWLPGAQIGAVILTNSETGTVLRNLFVRRLAEILYDGEPRAERELAAAADRLRTQRAGFWSRLDLTPDASATAALARAYTNHELGRLLVTVGTDEVRFATHAWSSRMATRRNADGTLSFVTVEPGFYGIDFMVGRMDDRPTLTVREAQHEYLFAGSD